MIFEEMKSTYDKWQKLDEFMYDFWEKIKPFIERADWFEDIKVKKNGIEIHYEESSGWCGGDIYLNSIFIPREIFEITDDESFKLAIQELGDKKKKEHQEMKDKQREDDKKERKDDEKKTIIKT